MTAAAHLTAQQLCPPLHNTFFKTTSGTSKANTREKTGADEEQSHSGGEQRNECRGTHTAHSQAEHTAAPAKATVSITLILNIYLKDPDPSKQTYMHPTSTDNQKC